jgi:hypothetical protein
MTCAEINSTMPRNDTKSQSKTLEREDLYQKCKNHMAESKLPLNGNLEANGIIQRYSKNNKKEASEWYIAWEGVSLKGNHYLNCVYGSWSQCLKYKFNSYDDSSIIDDNERKKLHEVFKNQKIEAFWDKKGVPDFFQPLPNVIFHKVNDILFLEKMSQCMALMTTAGFESVCEAMYLGKPVMMVPVGGQYEQNCNALDAKISGAGIIGKSFDFKLLYDY